MTNKTALIIKTPKLVQDSHGKFIAFFEDLHKFFEDEKKLKAEDKVISLELILKENYFHYRIILSPHISSVVKALLFSYFQETEILETGVEDLIDPAHTVASEFSLKYSNYFPILTGFDEANDPYILLSAILSKLNRFHDQLMLQIVISPNPDPVMSKLWRQNFSFLSSYKHKMRMFVEKPFVTRGNMDYSVAMTTKFGKHQFFANFRMLASGESKEHAESNFELMSKALEKFDNGDFNKLRKVKGNSSEKVLQEYAWRSLKKPRMLLNTKELATLFHFPNSNLAIDTVYHVTSKKVEPPKELPMGQFLENPSISIFAKTNSRGNSLQFGIKRIDRRRHLYVVGKTGMGKSRLLELLLISDIMHDKGFCVIDPHGDLATEVLRFIPQERMKDVIYFNPSDLDYPVGFNPLECFTPEAKHQVVTGFIGIFKKLFAGSWTNRLEHMLRFTILALLETEGATVVDIVKLLTDINYRQWVIKQIQDPVVKNFWTHEFTSWNEKFDNEAIIPIINQVGQFISNEYIRNVVGQKQSRLDFTDIMNSGKILIVNLAKGKLGEENTSLLGSMIITKIQEAVMARVSMPESERREFYLYVDEFQNFATESFNQILSEARKFNLCLTIAHQYIDQLSESIRKTAFGNIGSMICFRVGSDDAHYLANEFSPKFVPDDLINLDFREMCAKLSIDGKTSEPFSATSITVPNSAVDLSAEIIEESRRNYALSRKEVETEMFGNESMGFIANQSTSKSSQEYIAPVVASSQSDEFEEPLVN